MRIKWYGTASLLLESGSTRLLIDPYLRSRNKKLPPVPLEEAKTAAAAFITHPHLDHFADIDAFTEKGVPVVYTSENGIAHAKQNGLNTDPMLPYEPNEEVKIGDLTVHTYHSRHCVFDAPTVLRVVFSPRAWGHFASTIRLLKQARAFRIDGDICALSVSDGEKTVMVLGSAGMDPNVEYPCGADLLVFPYQGRSRMSKYMVPFLEVFRPKAVMIDHFDDAFPPLTHTINMKNFLPTVQRVLPEATAFVPAEGEWYEV